MFGGGKGRTCVDVAKFVLAARWGLRDRPVHEVQVEVVEAEVGECLLKTLENEVRAMAAAR